MNIVDFIAEYDKAQNKETFLKKHITKNYVSFEQKVAVSRNIVRSALGNAFTRNTPAVYMTFVIAMVREYTDIEVQENESLKVFNALDEKGIIDGLTSGVGRDADTFNTVLKMVVDDEIDNHNDIVNYLTGRGEAFSKVLDAIDGTLTQLIETRRAELEKE